MSLFGGDTEAPPLTCFNAGYGPAAMSSMRPLLVSLITKLGGDASTERIVDELVRVGHMHGLNVAMYQKGGAVAPGSGGSKRQLSGHMLQFFVQRDIVDSMAYASKPMGVPVKKFPSIQAYARQTPFAKGQVRIFMDPDVFTDPSLTRSFHYCSWPPLCSDAVLTRGASVLMTRGSMHQEFRRILRGFVGTRGALASTRRTVGIGVGLPRPRRPVYREPQTVASVWYNWSK